MKKNKAILAGVLATGIIGGSFLSPAVKGSAADNVILASVEWVTSQLNPLKSKVTSLEATVQSQAAEIAALRQAIEKSGTDVPSLPDKVYVQTSSATIHSGASRTYKIVSKTVKGTELKVVLDHDSTDGKWYRVEYKTGVYGWIHSGDTSISTVAKPTSVSITKTAYVYKGALTSYGKVGTLYAGQSVKYIGFFTNSNNELWYNVELSSGTKGWIQSGAGEVK